MNRSILSLTALLSFLCIPLRANNDPCIFNPKAIQMFGESDGINVPRWVEYSPDGKLLAVANIGSIAQYPVDYGTVQIYKVYPNGTLKLKTTLDVNNGIKIPSAVRFAPAKNSDCGYCLAVANAFGGEQDEGTVQIYSIDQKNYSVTLVQTLTEVNGIVGPTFLAFSPNGTCLAVGNGNRTITTYSFDVKTCTANIEAVSNVDAPEPPFVVRSLVFSPDGSCLLVAGGLLSFGLAMYRMNGCTIIEDENSPTIIDDNDDVIYTHGQFNACGDCLAVPFWNHTEGGSGGVKIYSLDNNCNVIETDSIGPFNVVPTQVVFSPDGNCLAVARFGDVFTSPAYTPGDKVTIYPFNKKDCIVDQENVTNLTVATPFSLAFSPNGNGLAVASGDAFLPGPIFDVDSYLRIFKTRKCVNVCEPCKD